MSLTIFRNASIGCLVDLVASAFLIHATFARKQILHENDWASDTCSAKNANEETVYNFFVYSLVSWVASAIIELKSCKFLICKIRLSHYDVRTLNKRQLFFLLLSLIASANACWVMLHFSSTVHKSFERLTGDPWLLMYYLMAAGVKNVRVFLQGMSCSHFGILHAVNPAVIPYYCVCRGHKCFYLGLLTHTVAIPLITHFCKRRVGFGELRIQTVSHCTVWCGPITLQYLVT